MSELYARPYAFNDAEALTIAARVCKLYEQRLATFEDFDPDLGPDFRDDFKLAIKTAMNISTDETVVDIQQTAAAITREKMALCADSVRTLRYYANLAFKGKAEFTVFGFDRLAKLRHTPANYAVAVRTMHLLAQQFDDALSDKGMTPAHVQALLLTANALIDAEVQHELHKRQRVHTTIHRKNAFTHLWSFVQRTHMAADVIYAEDEVTRGVFNL